MGWLGWTPETALATEAAFIESALASRTDLLSMVFGDGKPDKGKGQKGPITPQRFRDFAAQANRRMANDV